MFVGLHGVQVELRRTRVRFDGLEKRLSAAAQDQLEVDSADLVRAEAARSKARAAAARATLAEGVATVAAIPPSAQQQKEPEQTDQEVAAEVEGEMHVDANVTANVHVDVDVDVDVAAAAAQHIQRLFRKWKTRSILADAGFVNGKVNLAGEASFTDAAAVQQVSRSACSIGWLMGGWVGWSVKSASRPRHVRLCWRCSSIVCVSPRSTRS